MKPSVVRREDRSAPIFCEEKEIGAAHLSRCQGRALRRTDHKMSAIQLSPTQESARNRIEVALRSSPVIVKVKSPGLGIRTGTGISTLLRALSQTIEPSCAFLSIQDAVLCCPDGGGFSSTLKSVLTLGLKSLETSDVLIIDDLDLLAMPATIHSNGDSSEEKGHTR